jgi:hypothetical protein
VLPQEAPAAAEELLPLVYDELRKPAAAKLTKEKPGQTLQATALVHEAYLRLADVDEPQHWNRAPNTVQERPLDEGWYQRSNRGKKLLGPHKSSAENSCH